MNRAPIGYRFARHCGVSLAVAAAACSPTARHLAGAPAGAGAAAHLGSTRLADFGRETVSADARAIADWVVDSRDNRALPFIVVDKRRATVFVFEAEGRMRGASPALLGLARGDDSVPGIGDRNIADIRPEERTTPAGRFVAEMGHNTAGGDILWIDYDAAVSMHRVRATNPAERCLRRLAAPTPTTTASRTAASTCPRLSATGSSSQPSPQAA